MMIHQNWKNIAAAFVLLLSSSACLKDFEPTPVAKVGYGQIEITDAPIDDPNVKGVFLTIADVKVDGKSWAGFDGKTTFDLLAYHNGLAKLLGEGSLELKAYNEIVLVFDTETDANGNSPGCYVKDSSGTKSKLNGGSQMLIKVKGSFEPKAGDTTGVIIDMDLRKSIVYQIGTTNEYKFVSDPELASAIRLLDKASTGTISGDCTDGVSSSDKVVVYAYKKATYDINIEKFPQGTSQVQFKNAVASSAVEANGNYYLSLLDSGLYELHFISYKVEADGRLYAKGELQVSLLNTILDPLALDLSAKESLSVDLLVTGILFF